MQHKNRANIHSSASIKSREFDSVLDVHEKEWNLSRDDFLSETDLQTQLDIYKEVS